MSALVNYFIWFVFNFALKQRSRYTWPVAVQHNNLSPVSHFPTEREANDDLVNPSGQPSRYRWSANVLPFPASHLKNEGDRKKKKGSSLVRRYRKIFKLVLLSVVGWLLFNL
jgi:hypothetical protein|tara:strand:+ start:716 stop:1051 length:336 start_codon:yes stop_codon:yes gene_type:complete